MCILYEHILFLCSSVVGHVDCSLILAVVNNATVNTGVQLSVWVFVFDSFQYIPRVELGQLVKNPPEMQEALVQFLDWEDLLEKG